MKKRYGILKVLQVVDPVSMKLVYIQLLSAGQILLFPIVIHASHARRPNMPS